MARVGPVIGLGVIVFGDLKPGHPGGDTYGWCGLLDGDLVDDRGRAFGCDGAVARGAVSPAGYYERASGRATLFESHYLFVCRWFYGGIGHATLEFAPADCPSLVAPFLGGVRGVF